MRLIIRSLCLLTIILVLAGCQRQSFEGVNSASEQQDVKTGMAFFKQRKFREAIPHFEKAIKNPKLASSKSDLLTIIGNCYNELDEFEKSLEYHERAITIDPSNHKAYVNQGIVYRLLGNYAEAEASYNKALALKPDYAKLHASLGALALFQKKNDKAIEYLEKAISLDKTMPVAHSNLALVYAPVGRFDDAEKELNTAKELGYHQPEVIRQRIDQLKKTEKNN